MIAGATRYLVVVIAFCAVILDDSAAGASPVFWYFTGHTYNGTFATGAFIFDPAKEEIISAIPPQAHYRFLDGFFAQIGAVTLTGDLEFYVALIPFPGPYTGTDYDLHSLQVVARPNPVQGNPLFSVQVLGCSVAELSVALPPAPPCDFTGFLLPHSSPANPCGS